MSLPGNKADEDGDIFHSDDEADGAEDIFDTMEQQRKKEFFLFQREMEAAQAKAREKERERARERERVQAYQVRPYFFYLLTFL